MQAGTVNLGTQTAPPRDGSAPEYRLIRQLARGGFAEVWEAESTGGLRVALKLVQLPDPAGPGELRAVETFRGVRHPHLLVVFGAWQVDNRLIIGMELADRSLWDRFREAASQGKPGIPRRELLGYLADASAGIDYLNGYKHSVEGRPGVGIQHRDLKPQNILLFGDSAKVADFGTARVMERTVASHTGTTWTLPYAPPEFFCGRTARQSDQYALAVTYCQLRCGVLPFRGNTAAITAGHMFSAPDLQGLPEAERPIVARALSKRPEDRWSDCRSFVEALSALDPVETHPHPAPDRQAATRRSGAASPPRETVRPPTSPPRNPADPDSRARPLMADRAPSGSALALPGWGWDLGVAALVLATLITLMVLWVRSAAGLATRHAPTPTPVARAVAAAHPRPPRAASVPAPPATGSGGGAGLIRRAEPVRTPTTEPPARLDRDRAAPAAAVPPAPEEDPAADADTEARPASAEGPTPDEPRDIEPPPPPPPQANRDYDEGRALLRRGEYSQAVAALTRAIRQDPDPVEPLFSRGLAFELEKRYPEALDDYNEAVRRRPSAKLHLARGRVYRQLEKYDRALADLSEAIRLQPGDVDSYQTRAGVYYALGRYDQAIGDYTEAIRRRPSDPQTHYRRGLVRYTEGDNVGAVSDLTRAIELDPNYAWAYRYRGEAYARLGDIARAEGDHRALDRLIPGRGAGGETASKGRDLPAVKGLARPRAAPPLRDKRTEARR